MIKECPVDNLADCASLANWFYESTLKPKHPFDKDCFVTSWKAMLEAQCGMIVCRYVDGIPVEAIGWALYPDPNNGRLSACTVFWYVAGEAVGLEGGRLYSDCEVRLKGRGVKTMYISALFNDRLDKVSDFLHRSGYVPVELHYRKDLD